MPERETSKEEQEAADILRGAWKGEKNDQS